MATSGEHLTFVRECVSRMLQPIASFCVSRGLHFPELVEVAKVCFVRAAEEKLRKEQGTQEISISRLSVMTGIQRPEVNRLRSKPAPRQSKDFVTRILGQWCGDKRFYDSKRQPRILGTEGKNSEFARLVRAVSTDLNSHTVRFELERLGLVEHSEGKLRLLQSANVTTGRPLDTLRFASEDTRDLLEACQENAFCQDLSPNLHARTQYDNIPDEALPKIREWLLEFGQRIHDECRRFLSSWDRDLNPHHAQGTGKNRVIVGTFSRVEKLSGDRRAKVD